MNLKARGVSSLLFLYLKGVSSMKLPEIKVKITNTDVFIQIMEYIKTIILDDRMPGDLANEMQEKIGDILKGCKCR